MYNLLSPLKYIQARKLQNTQWRCDTKIEAEAEYYQLNFISFNQVEGYSKIISESEPLQMFTANFEIKDKTTIQFFHKNESFTAHLTSNILMATIDGETLLFRRF